MPRLNRVTSNCKMPLRAKVRIRDVTSTCAPGTPQSAPTNSPPCAIAEPASNSMHAKLATANANALNFMVVSRTNHRVEACRKHRTKVHRPVCSAANKRVAKEYQPNRITLSAAALQGERTAALMEIGNFAWSATRLSSAVEPASDFRG